MLIFLTVLVGLLEMGFTQLSTTSGGLSIDLNPELTMLPSASTTNTTDVFRKIEFSRSFLITLTSANIVQILNRTSPNLVIQNYENYSTANIQPYIFYTVAVDQSESIIVLTSYANTLLQHLTFSFGSTGIKSLTNITGDLISADQPHSTFIMNSEIFLYFKSSKTDVNDSFYITDLTTNVSRTVTLNDSGC